MGLRRVDAIIVSHVCSINIMYFHLPGRAMMNASGVSISGRRADGECGDANNRAEPPRVVSRTRRSRAFSKSTTEPLPARVTGAALLTRAFMGATLLPIATRGSRSVSTRCRTSCNAFKRLPTPCTADALTGGFSFLLLEKTPALTVPIPPAPPPTPRWWFEYALPELTRETSPRPSEALSDPLPTLSPPSLPEALLRPLLSLESARALVGVTRR